MIRLMRRLCIFCFAVMLPMAGARTGAEVVQAFDAQVPFAPTVADSGGAPQLAYELHLTNFAARPIVIDRITVLDTADHSIVAASEGEALADLMGHAGAPGKAALRKIAPGMRALVYFNLPLANAALEAISHRVDFHFADDDGSSALAVTTSPARIDPRPLPVIGPPLRGGPWAAVHAPEMERGHRRVVYATEGAARIPGRFAIDWFLLDDGGRMASGEATRVDRHHGYGADVLAVADAIVVAVRDDVPEPELIADASRVTIGDATGNYIALDLGGGRFAFYEHLQPGIGLRVGDRVRRGQVIARLGFTGQTTAPHLHFHLADANSPLGAEGLPYRIRGAAVLGAYPSIEAFGRGGPWQRIPVPARADFFPAPNMVVRFPEM